VASDDRLTVKVAVVVPVLPSVTVTSSMESERHGAARAAVAGEVLLRGNGVVTKKSPRCRSFSTASRFAKVSSRITRRSSRRRAFVAMSGRRCGAAVTDEVHRSFRRSD
jgi:hypothetical protein